MSNQTDLIDYLADLTNRDVDVSEHFYDILRSHPSAEQEVIESAYRRLLRLYHPDVNKHPLANNVTKVLIDAYAILGDPIKRAEYDAYLASKKTDSQPTSRRDREEQVAFYMERGEAYETNDKPALAIQDFTRAIELDPHNRLGLSMARHALCTGRRICPCHSRLYESDRNRLFQLDCSPNPRVGLLA